MASEPEVWQEQGPVKPLDEWVNESWARGEEGAIMSHSSPLHDKKAPRAEPEEDIDILEPEAQDKTLPENQTLSRTEIAAELAKQESTRINLCIPGETKEIVTELERVAQLSEALQTGEESEESGDLCEDSLLPPPPVSALSTEERFETEGFFSLEGEAAEWISDAEIISDPAEDLVSPDSPNSQEWSQSLPEPFDSEDSTPEEMTGDSLTKEESVTQLYFLPDGKDGEPENDMSGALAAVINSTHHSSSDRNNSDDVYTVSSPPFADESGEEEDVSGDIMSCQQQCSAQDIRSEPLRPSSPATVSTVSPEQTSHLPSVSLTRQQEELLTQSQCKPAPRGANQEAAQQVLGQSSLPLSTVAMELSDQGGAASQGCVVAVRERHSREGERTGESEQIGGEEGHKEGGLEGNELVWQQQGRRPSKTVKTQELKTERTRFVSSKHNRMESDSCDDSQSDSGVSADFSPCSTLEGNTSISTGTPAAPLKETPIEREIRRAIEREHSLRRSRGLPSPPTTPEYVEIPMRKTVLYQSVTAKSERCHGKDKQFAGKKMQSEIHEEVQREQDLVKLGKVLGVYDKGTVRQLREKKQLFEAFQTPDESTLTVSTRSKTTSWSSSSDVSTLEIQEDISSGASTIQGSYGERSPTQSPTSTKGGGPTSRTPHGPGFSEAADCPIIILENNLSVPAQRLYHAKPEAHPVTVVDHGGQNNSSYRTGGHVGVKGRAWEQEEEEAEMAPAENPFFKLRSSTNVVKVEQDIRETQEREKELHKQRISLYGGIEGSKGGGVGGGGGGGGGRPSSTEGKSPMLYSSSSLNGLAVPDLPGSPTRTVTGPPAARQSVGKLGMWPPAQAEEEKINRPEVLHSPRSPRQKTPLVQRWESGQVNGHNKEDD